MASRSRVIGACASLPNRLPDFWTTSQAASNAAPKIPTAFGSKAPSRRNGTMDMSYRLHRRNGLVFDENKRQTPKATRLTKPFSSKLRDYGANVGGLSVM